MKTITLDFDLYEKELADERRTGADIVFEIDKRLLSILHSFQSYDANAWEKAKKELTVLINDIQRKSE